MIPIGNDDPRVILLHGYDDWLAILQRIYFSSIHHGPYLQETQQHLVLPLEYYVKRSCDCLKLLVTSSGSWGI